MNASEVRTAVVVGTLALMSACSSCIGVIDWGDPGEDGRPLDLPDYDGTEEVADVE